MKVEPVSISQNPDVRYLGKLLGDVIRAYGGRELFQRIENIRASSVDRHRGLGGARVSGAGLDTLTLDEALAFTRSFMLFSMLANLAEDRQRGGATRVSIWRPHSHSSRSAELRPGKSMRCWTAPASFRF